MTNHTDGSRYQGFIELVLTSPRFEAQRSKELASVERCVELLHQGDTGWDVMFAVCTHVEYYHYEDESRRYDWASKALGPVMDTVTRTAYPPPPLPVEGPFPQGTVDPQLSRYFHSGVAAGLLLEEVAAPMAQQYLEEANEVLANGSSRHLSTDIVFAGADRVRRVLQRLYEASEDYERALDMHLSAGIAIARPEFFERCFSYCSGWLFQQLLRPSVPAAIDLLDNILHLVKEAESSITAEDNSPADWPRGTRQFWSWFYGLAVGKLVVAHPYLKDALLQEVRSGEWPEGWAAVSLIVEESADWPRLRDLSKALYDAADGDIRATGFSHSPEPVHLSPQSDLYWAMRVGFCEAQLDAETGSSLQDANGLQESLDDIRERLSALSLRAIRSHQEIKEGLGAVVDAVATDGVARLALEEALGSEAFQILPSESTQHLVAAKLARLQGRPDDARVATAKAIEAVFTRILQAGLLPHTARLQIVVKRGRGSESLYSVEDFGRIQLSEWAIVLRGIAAKNGVNAALADAVAVEFPGADVERLATCWEELRVASTARGSAAHDGGRETYDEKQEQAEKLWELTVGTPVTPGLLAHLCMALGLANSNRT